jgi:DNA-binding transcriptional regulator YiaG
MAFVGPCPAGMEACHCDGVPSNNVLSNLRWDTKQSNSLDTKRHGTYQHGINHFHAKLTDEKVRTIRSLYTCGTSQTRLAKQFGVRKSTIQDVVNNRTWIHV